MTTKHTPGPWSAVDSEYGIFVRIQPTFRNFGMPVAQVWAASDDSQRSWSVRGPEARANASLIAAAPDLLVALRALIALHDGGYSTQSDVQPVVAQARSALAKVAP